MSDPVARLAARLADAGFVAAEEEAGELLNAARDDRGTLDALVARRLAGEPLAWITGTAMFCGHQIALSPGVYVPRPQSEKMARIAAGLLPTAGVAIDLCTGCGAIAVALARHRPAARVVASDIDERSVACAAANGVEVYCGDLFEPLPAALAGTVDVVAAVVPYVPTSELRFLQRDTLTFETSRSYDGGPDGTATLRRVLAGAALQLRLGGAVVVELGGDQADILDPELAALGFVGVTVMVDDDGDVRGLSATLGKRAHGAQRPAPRC